MVRVRFAPAPTGYLHLGGARTALFNWLFVKQQQGKFILRIEDTDVKRSTDESVNAILDSLKWLGITWDEGPYFQSQRTHIYQEYAKKLLQDNQAYYCYCSPSELEILRKKATGEAPGYDGRCRNLSPTQRQEYESSGRKPTIRFKSPSGLTQVNDLIRGKVSFDNALFGDFIIFKSDGMPTYNFACIIDDALMEITHVIRGEDHISNTPRQILLYQALGFKIPVFAHLPLILGLDKTPLSKRHGDVAIEHYRQEGYLPEALMNYLALLGWSTPQSQQIFSKEELLIKFSIDRVSKNPAIFDLEKLRWLNGEYIRRLDIDSLTVLCWEYLNKIRNSKFEIRNLKFKEIVRLFQERIKTLSDFVKQAEFFFVNSPKYHPSAVEQILMKDGVRQILEQVKDRLVQLEPFDTNSIEKTIRELADQLKIKASDIIHPLRVALTGDKVSPGLFEVVALLGKEKVQERLIKRRWENG
ncbi:MAG: glutamate--tRNA ligase [bacterium]